MARSLPRRAFSIEDLPTFGFPTRTKVSPSRSTRPSSNRSRAVRSGPCDPPDKIFQKRFVQGGFLPGFFGKVFGKVNEGFQVALSLRKNFQPVFDEASKISPQMAVCEQQALLRAGPDHLYDRFSL